QRANKQVCPGRRRFNKRGVNKRRVNKRRANKRRVKRVNKKSALLDREPTRKCALLDVGFRNLAVNKRRFNKRRVNKVNKRGVNKRRVNKRRVNNLQWKLLFHHMSIEAVETLAEAEAGDSNRLRNDISENELDEFGKLHVELKCMSGKVVY
ncbi:hypothetical protein L9F63_022589, partial [Diploptera punctata]